VSLGSIIGGVYQIYIGMGLIVLDVSVPKAQTNPLVYPVVTPVANIITCGCIAGLIYGGYHSKKTSNLRPTAQDGNSVTDKSSIQYGAAEPSRSVPISSETSSGTSFEFERQHSSVPLEPVENL